MLALLQRVTNANVKIDNKIISEIGHGLLILLCVEKTDSQSNCVKMAQKVLSLRIFPDQKYPMNVNITDVKGELLVVPQFTLAADTRKGNRPGFAGAALPDKAVPLFEHFVNTVSEKYAKIKLGKFGADMKVELVNDGPVTIWLET